MLTPARAMPADHFFALWQENPVKTATAAIAQAILFMTLDAFISVMTRKGLKSRIFRPSGQKLQLQGSYLE